MKVSISMIIAGLIAFSQRRYNKSRYLVKSQPTFARVWGPFPCPSFAQQLLLVIAILFILYGGLGGYELFIYRSINLILLCHFF